MTTTRWEMLTWGERLLLEDALANYAGEYRDNVNYMRLAAEMEAELRDTLNADRTAAGLDD